MVILDSVIIFNPVKNINAELTCINSTISRTHR